jgi:hypothetical protein
MNRHLDPETLKIPAFRRKNAIYSRARQKLIMTALDRKEAGVSLTSTRSTSSKISSRTPIEKVRNAEPAIPIVPKHSNFVRYEQPITDSSLSQEIKEPENAPTMPSSEMLHGLKPKKIQEAGEITHFLDKISVAIIMLSKPLKEGDVLLIEGGDYLAIQPVTEMQIERKPVKRAKKGSHIGLKVKFEAKVYGKVYKLA